MKNQVNFAESLKRNKAHTATGTEVSPATPLAVGLGYSPPSAPTARNAAPDTGEEGGRAPTQFVFQKNFKPTEMLILTPKSPRLTKC